MKTNHIYVLITFVLLLSSCGGSGQTASATETNMPATATSTALPTDTPVPSPTLTPTITPIPMPEVITASNVNRLKIMMSPQVNTGWWEMATTSPDGKYFATAGPAGVIFYDSETLERVELLNIEESTVAIAFSPDASKMAIGMPAPGVTGEENEKRRAIEVWDLKTRKRLHRFTGYKEFWEVSSLSFSGDGCLIFSYSQIIHNICDNSEIKSGDKWRIKNEFYDQRTYFSPDGQLGLVHISSDWGVWDVKNNKKLRDLILRRPSFSPDSKRIMDLAEKRVFLYETSDFSKSLEFNTKAKIVTAKISFDGAYIATAENDGMLRLYDTVTGELKSETQSSMYLVVGLNFTPDGKYVTMLDDRGYLKKSELPTLNLAQEHKDLAVNQPVAFSPDGKQIAMRAVTFSYLSGGYDTIPGNLVILFDAETLEVTGQLVDGQPADSGIGALTFSPDGRILAGASRDNGFVDLWDMSTMQLIKRLEISPGKVYSSMDPSGNLWGGVAFNADASLVAALNPVPDASQVYIWDVSSGKRIANFNPLLHQHPTLKDFKRRTQYLYSIEFDPTDDSKLMFGQMGLGPFDWKEGKWIDNSNNGNDKKYKWPVNPSGDLMVVYSVGKLSEDKQFALVESAYRNWGKFNNCITIKQDCLFVGESQGTPNSPDSFMFSSDGRTLYQIAGNKIYQWQVMP